MGDAQPSSNNRDKRIPQQRTERMGFPRTEDTCICVRGKDFIRGDAGFFKTLREHKQDWDREGGEDAVRKCTAAGSAWMLANGQTGWRKGCTERQRWRKMSKGREGEGRGVSGHPLNPR